MTALVLAAWIAATVARLAAALRRLADAVAPLTVEAPRPVPAPAAVASRATPVRIAPEARRPAPADETTADVADPRALARACLAAEGAAPAPGWPAGRAVAHGYLATALLPALPADLRVRLGRWRAAVATPKRPAPTELHYVRDYHTTICGGPLGGASRATGSPQMWHAEPPATRCPTCAAELRRADPHRFDTRLQGITDTSGDADELLSREPPFAGRGGSL